MHTERQQRVIEEREELKAKIVRLNYYLSNGDAIVKDSGIAVFELMKAQVAIMTSYAMILDCRIALFAR